YLARANALEANVRFYYVQNGRRIELKGWNGRVASGVWHELRADMRGDRVEVYFNGAKVIDGRDGRFPNAGRVGVSTKPDSYTQFDNRRAPPLRGGSAGGLAAAPACYATDTSMTPPAFGPRRPAAAAAAPAQPGLSLLREIPLPGSASRFDYQ